MRWSWMLMSLLVCGLFCRIGGGESWFECYTEENNAPVTGRPPQHSRRRGRSILKVMLPPCSCWWLKHRPTRAKHECGAEDDSIKPNNKLGRTFPQRRPHPHPRPGIHPTTTTSRKVVKVQAALTSGAAREKELARGEHEALAGLFQQAKYARHSGAIGNTLVLKYSRRYR